MVHVSYGPSFSDWVCTAVMSNDVMIFHNVIGPSFFPPFMAQA